MFSIEQINEIHTSLSTTTTLPHYLLTLKAIGVIKYDSFVADGHAAYYGEKDHAIITPPAYELQHISNEINKAAMQYYLALHQQGELNYFELSKKLATCGVAKWTFDTHQMTLSFYDKAGHSLLLEEIQ